MSTKSNFIQNKYIDITDLIQKEFNRNVELHGNRIKCGKGCSQCCHQIFNITMIDAHIIEKHLSSLSISERDHLKEKARVYLTEFNSSESAGEFYNKPKQPCPALNELGECTIYEARPIICRKFGPPVYDYKNPEKLFACVLNFRDGEEIIDSELIPNQTLIGVKWDELKTVFNIENGYNKNASTTIAEAIINS